MRAREADVGDVRLVAMMMEAFSQVWAGRLGGGPQSDSPLAKDREAEERFSTTRRPMPLGQAWTYAQTLGQVAHNHEQILREALQRSANHEGARPVSTIDTLTRVIVELLARQVWLTDPALTTEERFGRMLALERDAVKSEWRITNPGEAHEVNPSLAALETDAERCDLVLPRVPEKTQLAGALFERAPLYVPEATITSRIGEMMYRLLSGAIHGDVAHLLGVLLPTGEFNGEKAVCTYSLSASMLWRAAACFFLSTFAARSTYADWLGIDVPDETKRLSLHHIRLSTRRLGT